MAAKKKGKKKGGKGPAHSSKVDALRREAQKLYEQQDLNTAAEICRKALQRDKNVGLTFLLGNICYDMGDVEGAREAFQQTLELKPDHQLALYNLGVMANDAHEQDIAESYFLKVLQLDPSSSVSLYNLALICLGQNRIDEGVDHLNKVIELSPNFIEAYSELAEIRKQQGKSEEAEALLTKALQISPRFPNANIQLALLQKASPESPLFPRLTRICHDNSLPAAIQARARYALGKLYTDAADYDKAFEHYKEANDIQQASLPVSLEFEWDEYRKQIETTLATCSATYLDEHQEWGSDSQLPIFVVGMPRSGTTLVEQIIASHPQAAGAGELTTISSIYGELIPSETENLADELRQLTREQIQAAAQEYLHVLEPFGPGCDRIVDKMPGNFQFLWLVRLMFRNPRIVFCRRDPLDTCISCYFQNFTYQHTYKFKLDTLGEYYNLHLKQMQHWQQLMPDNILELPYEGLIESPEEWMRRLISFVGLEWDDACLNFHQTDRFIRTSVDQVRKPLYSSSIGRWKRYEKHLGELIKQLA